MPDTANPADQASRKDHEEQDALAEAWIPGERGKEVDLGKSTDVVHPHASDVAVPHTEQPQGKVDLAAVAMDEKDPVTVGSEESFPASDPPSYQPGRAGE